MWANVDRRTASRTVRHARRVVGGDARLPRPDLPEGHDTLPEIRHIVVLMMENHSFDNYLGTLGRGEGLPTDPQGRPSASNPRVDGRAVPAHHLASTTQERGAPTQSWHASHLQRDGGAMDGFPRSIEETVQGQPDPDVAMGYWTEEDLPFYASLARTFPLADRWFGSCLGPTFPNRRFLIAGTAHGLIDDLAFAMVDYPEAGTILDVLSHHGISWINYHDVARAGTVIKRSLGRRGLTALRYLGLATFKWWPPLVEAMRGNLQFTADLYPLGLAGAITHLRSLQQFFVDADAGTLPAVSIVDPNFSKFSEENPQDVQIGEGFAAAVIERVMRAKGWPGTILIWLYDEHGGYYDHVDPPPAPAPDGVEGRSPLFLPRWVRAVLRPAFGRYIAQLEAIDQGDRAYDRLGFRVPAVIVSPYARVGFVTSEVHDHTSILKLIERKWNLPPLTARDAAATDPLEAVDFQAPPAFLEPPDLATGPEVDAVTLDSQLRPIETLSGEDRGRALRQVLPRRGHADAAIASTRLDPVALLESANEGRVPELVPLRFARMAASPFGFFRGAAAIMAQDLAATSVTGIQVQLCGDAHLSNFGLYATPERRLVFGVNDFDETLRGPWEWDLKRLAASLVVAGRDIGLSERQNRTAAVTAARAYREHIRAYARLGLLDVWYATVDVTSMLPLLRSMRARARRTAERARERDHLQALSKLTEVIGGAHRIRHAPPLVVRIDQEAAVLGQVDGLIQQYRATLPEERRVLFDRYHLTDVAMKVVGVGSVGTHCWIGLLHGEGNGPADPLFLQVKEARASVLEAALGPSPLPHHGRWVVVGQRLMQAFPDVLLGWTAAEDSGRQYYVRQLQDMKGSFSVQGMTATELGTYGALCAWTLARSHSRSGDAPAIGAYLGSSTTFDVAIGEYASAYADQNDRDHRALLAAMASGRVVARTGV